jgi:hypothetical protein
MGVVPLILDSKLGATRGLIPSRQECPRNRIHLMCRQPDVGVTEEPDVRAMKDRIDWPGVGLLVVPH